MSSRYRCFDVTPTSLGTGNVLLHSQWAGASRIYPAAQAQTLLACQEFDTLQNHAIAQAQKGRQNLLENGSASFPQKLLARFIRFAQKNGAQIPLHKKEIAPIKQQLAQFLEDGFLVPEEDIRADILASCPSANAPTPRTTVRSVGIPTRNRPKSLKRALSSYIQNSKNYGRSPDFIVVDDSRSKKVQDNNKAVLAHLKRGYGSEIFYVDRNRREQFARTLAHQGDLPLEVTRFALLGESHCSMTIGACRNSLLLQTVGEACLQVDDDTVCSIATPLDRKEGLRLTSKSSAHDARFFKDYDKAVESASFIDTDFLGIHEQLLGRDVSSCIAEIVNNQEQLDIGEIGPDFLKKIRADNAQVAITLGGGIGDSGWHKNSNLSRLLAEGDSYEHLTASKPAYHDKLNTRQIIRAPKRPSVTNNSFCMAMNLGLDNHVLLPPFMPVQRNEDGLFGDLLSVCFNEAHIGSLPYAVVHKPPGSRSHVTVIDDNNISMAVLRTPDILEAILAAFAPQLHGRQGARNLQALGQYLTDLASLESMAFKNEVRSMVRHMISRRVRFAERRLEEEGGKPAFWAKDVQRYIAGYRGRAVEEDYFVPSDLAGNLEERQMLFQELAGTFGKLLTYWPQIIKTAKELRAAGCRLAVAIDRAHV